MGNSTGNRLPRILVISNNSFSSTSNNGKTLASFFDKYPITHIAQLYFSPEIPDTDHYSNYYRITDRDVLSGVIKNTIACGGMIFPKRVDETDKNVVKPDRAVNILKRSDIARIIRELFWKSGKWKTRSLDQWLEKFSPDIVFFCAGDSGFAFDITEYIKEKFSAKLITYITDDYVLPRKAASLFWRIRRKHILNKMKKTVGGSDLFITISDPMKNEYKRLFGKDSMICVNMTDSIKDTSITNEEETVFTMVYAGGLHYKRYLTLSLLAGAIKRFNDDQDSTQKAYLKIYSTQAPGRSVLKKIEIEGASEFCGGLYPKELVRVLNQSSALVFAESFDKRSVDATRLSISTKIPEYLSLGKPIIAIGPEGIASMKYLDDCALCIIDKGDISEKITEVLKDSGLRDELSTKALLKFNSNHIKEIVSGQMIEKILEAHGSMTNNL